MRYFIVLFFIWHNEVSIHGKFQDHTCDIKEFQSIHEVSSWTNEILQSQDKERHVAAASAQNGKPSFCFIRKHLETRRIKTKNQITTKTMCED